MADKLTFTSAVLLGFSRNGTGGKAKFSSSMNQKVSAALGWQDIPEFLTGASLEGELHATTIELRPNEEQLRRHGIELNVSEVAHFESIRLEIEGKKGKGHRTELRFTVTFPDTKGARKLEEYMLTIGEGKSSLVVSYTKQETLPGVEDTKQDTLPGVKATNEQRRATSAESDQVQ